jgi:hypothetical protein
MRASLVRRCQLVTERKPQCHDCKPSRLAQRTLTRRVVGAVTDDPTTIELYFGYARQGRSALWVHVPDRADANRAVRCLADHQVLHFRHYGHSSQDDLHIR